MDILVITWNYPPRRGGIEKLTFRLCDQLRKNHHLFVITSFASSADTDGAGVFRPKRPGIFSFALYALAKGFFLLWKRRGIKVILGGSALVVPLVLFLARVFHRKAVVNVHGSDLLYPNVLYQILCVRGIRYCDRIVANSGHTASLAEKKKVKPDSILVISPGVDSELFSPCETDEVKKQMGLEGRKVLFYVGRLARRKGVKEFLKESFPRIHAEIREICFLVVGGNPSESLIHRDDMLGELGILVREQGLDDHVRLLGQQSDADLARIYQISDLMVLPIISMRDDVEGFGIVILEAAAVGKPCVATRVGGIPDAVEDGKSGIIVEPGDYQAMAQAVIRLLRDDQTRQRLGDYAQKRARERFDWGLIARRHEKVLEALAREGTR